MKKNCFLINFLIILTFANTKCFCNLLSYELTKNYIVGYFSLGYSDVYIDNLNKVLKSYSYKEFKKNFFSLGGGFYFVSDKILYGFEGFGLISKQQDNPIGYKTNISFGYGIFNLGYLLYSYKNTKFYPIFGIGAGALEIKISKKGNFSFDEILSDPKIGCEISTGGFLLSLCFGIDFIENKKNGIFLGIRTGYTFSPTYDWYIENTTISSSPDVGLNSFFVRLNLGFAGTFKK